MADTSFDLQVDPQFSAAMGTLTKAEEKALEKNLQEQGRALDPIKVWKGTLTIVDGHNRYRLCERHQLPFDVQEVEFKDREAVLDWIWRWQDGRRNRTPQEMSLLRAAMYQERVTSKGGDRKSPNADNTNAAEEVAERTGVARSTIMRDNRRSKAVDNLAVNLSKSYRSGELSLSDAELFALAEFDKASQQTMMRQVRVGDYETVKDVLQANGALKEKPKPSKPAKEKPTAEIETGPAKEPKSPDAAARVLAIRGALDKMVQEIDSITDDVEECDHSNATIEHLDKARQAICKWVRKLNK